MIEPYFNCTLNENGVLVTYGSEPEDYLTDVLSGKATDFIRRTTAPFFIYLTPHAPHEPAIPAPRHVGFFADRIAPRPPSFNEADISDKPTWIRAIPLLTQSEIDAIDAGYRDRLETMLAVDDMVAAQIRTLEETGQLDNTFIFFTSDNGYHLGQHRLIGKDTIYEEDIRVPLIVRGPGVPAGQTVNHLALNSDLAPTLAELAGASAPEFVDGRSLVRVLSDTPPPLANWRQRFLVESWPPHAVESGMVYHALRTQEYIYVEYLEEHELYDLESDPYQLDSFYSTADPDLIAQLASQLDPLRDCAAASCRSAEARTPPTITTQPADTTVRAGQRAHFSVTATGTPPLHAQWTKNGVNITGATRRSYTTPPTTEADNGALFAVTVSNSAGSVTSNNATLTVQ